MTLIAESVLDRAGESLGGFLPRVAGALLLLAVGVLLARLLGRLLTRALKRVGLDELAERLRAGEVLDRAGLGRSLSRLIGGGVGIALTLVVVFAALSLLGLQFLSESLNQAILFLPKLGVAALLLLVGVVLGSLARERLERLAHQMDFPVPLGVVAQVAVVAVFAITAAAQIAVSTAVLVAIGGILLAAVAATFTIAFGLGGREVARELSAGRYLREAYETGQEISFGGVRGEVVALESAATVLRTPQGETVRVPNNLLLGSVVTVHGSPTRREPGAPST